MGTQFVVRAFSLGLGLAWLGLAGPAEAAAQTPSRWLPIVGLTVNTARGRPNADWGLGGQAALLRRSGRIGFGVEAGYQAFGVEVTTIDDFNNQPGWVYREEFRRSMLRLAAVFRLEGGSGSVRPYLVGGAGGYQGRWRDRIEVTDATGTAVPLYHLDASGADVKPGLTAGLGVIRRRPGARIGVGMEGRWHGIIDMTEDGLGTANFLALGLVLTW